MIYKIILVGRTNVGKSTLFNRLTNTKKAIIHNEKNYTRDIQSHIIFKHEKIIEISDTGGIDSDYNNIDNINKNINIQTKLAIKNSHLILFILNIKDGITKKDQEIIINLRKTSKKIFIILNKIDLVKNYKLLSNEFYIFGIQEIILVSALHNKGIKKLFKNIFTILKKHYDLKVKNLDNINIINRNLPIISIIGRTNVGKSTLFNTFLNKKRVITSHTLNTTRDCISEKIFIMNKHFLISDTAGISKKSKSSKFSLPILKTFKNIYISDIIIILIDANEKISNQDLWIINTVMYSGKYLMIIFNKSENLSLKEKKNIKKYLLLKNKFMRFFDIYFISALYNLNIKKIFYSIQKSFKLSNFRMKISTLTNILHEAVDKYPPTLNKFNKIKLKYAHAGGYYPPKIIIHGQKLLNISLSYKNYLRFFFQKKLNIKGTLVNIIFK